MESLGPVINDDLALKRVKDVSPLCESSSLPGYLLALQALEKESRKLSLKFHLEGSELVRERAKSFKALHTAFEIESVVSVEHELHNQNFQICKQNIADQAGGSSNEKILFHATKGNLTSLLPEGLQPSVASKGLYGRGLYFTPDPLKANDYSPGKGNPNDLRVLLRCRVSLGLSKDYGVGSFDRDLEKAPAGFHSVRGFIRRSEEFVVYEASQVVIEEVVFYRFSDTAFEMAPCLNVPTNMTGRVVFITAALSEFLAKLQERTKSIGGSASEIEAKAAIASLLREEINSEIFMSKMGVLLKATPPAGLREKLDLELQKSKARREASMNAIAASAVSVPSSVPITTPVGLQQAHLPQTLSIPRQNLPLSSSGSFVPQRSVSVVPSFSLFPQPTIKPTFPQPSIKPTLSFLPSRSQSVSQSPKEVTDNEVSDDDDDEECYQLTRSNAVCQEEAFETYHSHLYSSSSALSSA